MRIQVKEGHISIGVPLDTCKCPVALAMRENTGIGWVSTLNTIGGGYACRNGKRLQRWIRRFDKGLKTKPIVISLNKRKRTAEIVHG